ncbi:cytochrome P450 [Camillea tinctor]|nr:cytochrome P450 [Camillea tinctor]
MAFESLNETFRNAPLALWGTAFAVINIVYFIVRGIYLLRYHPLSKYPGPKIAAVTDAWYAYHWLTGRYPWAIEAAFKKYGDVVRVAPNQVVFFTPEAQTDILMSGTKGRPTFRKTEFYPVFGKIAGIAAEKDPDKHRVVRKNLAPAFSPHALKEQDISLHRVTDRFVEKLEGLGGAEKGINMSEWFDWVACDLAGAFTYGHDFENVKEAKFSPFLDTFNRVDLWGTLDQTMKRFPLLYPLVFFALPPSLAKTIPWLLKENKRIVVDRIERRDRLEHPDYFSALVRNNKPVPSEEFLLAQANHLIIGGLDPVTNLFTSVLFFLLQYPDKLEKLQQEVRGTFASYDDIQYDALTHLPWLWAVMDESLRMHTNGAFGQPRYSPGATIDGHYIPKGCCVETSSFATSRSERYWAKPRVYAPERWLPSTHPDYDPIFDKDSRAAFKPFSMGPRGCPGQHMGYRQTSVLFAKMVWKLDWEFVNRGQVDWDRDTRLYAIWKRPPVMVKFKTAQHAIVE